MSYFLVYYQTVILVRSSATIESNMVKVNIQDAKTHLSRYIDQVERGEVIIVCRHNRPVAELRAVEVPPGRPARVAGLLKGRIIGIRCVRANDRSGTCGV